MKIVVSDFDGTLFRRYHGLIEETVAEVAAFGLPVAILTHRAKGQVDFMRETLDGSGLDVLGFYCTESRRAEVATKLFLMEHLMRKFEVVAAFDNELDVVVHYKELGIDARLV